MVSKRPKLLLDLEAQEQLYTVWESYLKTLKRGKPQTGDSSKAPATSPTKPVTLVDPPPISTVSGLNLGMVAQSSSMPTINMVETKNELAGTFAFFLDKVEEPQFGELLSSNSATIGNRITSACLDKMQSSIVPT